MSSPLTRFGGLVLAGALLVSAGWVLGSRTAGQPSSSTGAQEAFPLLAKRILVDQPNDPIVNFVPLRKALEQRLSTLDVPYSFSFEYLPTGTTIRSGDDVQLIGSSLLKLPIVMDLYKAAELGKIDLDTPLTIEPDMLNSDYGTLYQRGAGAKITLREAAKLTLEESDNTAILLIERRINGLLPPDGIALAAVDADFSVQESSVAINSKSYASILKCLYFACYNRLEDSQEILERLTKAKSLGRLKDGVPPSLTVAHKFGTSIKNITDSDCGIFYVPERPYVLCVMVRLPAEQASKFQAELSRLVYETVVKRN